VKTVAYIFLCVYLGMSTGWAQDTLVRNGFNRFLFPNGKVVSEGYLENGKPNGFWKNYFENGSLKSEGNRKNFQLDSTWKFYNNKSVLVTSIEYQNGVKNGYKKIFDPDSGFLLSEEHYIQDLKEGYTNYYKKDKVCKDVPFVKGKENGIGREYDKQGIIITLTTYKNSFLIREDRINRTDVTGKKQGNWKTFFPSGSVQLESRYTNDKLDGYLKEYNAKGDLIRTEKWVDGVLQKNAAELVKLDVRKEFHDNGKVKSSGTFKQGLAEGVTRYYGDDGALIGGKMYKSGALVGEGIYDERGNQQGNWKEYYTSGEIRAEGKYENGKRIGPWKFYHQNGKLEQAGTYVKGGKPDGDWKWYYESGSILREEHFERGKPEGEMREYNDSGKVITKGNFLDGDMDGNWFLDDGDEREEGTYKSGQRDGLWKFFFTNGKVAHQGKYIEGNEQDKHTYYYDNGRVMQEGSFIMGKREGTWRKYDREGNLVTTLVYRDDEAIKIDGEKIPDAENGDGQKTP